VKDGPSGVIRRGPLNLVAIHDFQERLAWSHDQEEQPFWEAVYRAAFPGLLSVNSVRQDGWAQRAGIDRVIVLSSGKVIKIDEKVRSKSYDDILLERWSDEQRKQPGWVQKPLDCDFIAYAFIDSGVCYLLPTLLLQRAWRENGRKWIAECQEVRAQNKGYVTVSIAVPIADLLDAIRECIIVPFSLARAA